MSHVALVGRLAVLLALALGCAARKESAPRPRADPGPPSADIHHELAVTLVPGGRRISVTDTVTLSPERRARAGDTLELSLHAGLSPERVGPGAPLVRVPTVQGAGGEGDDAPPVPIESFAVVLGPGERSFTVRYGGEVFHPIESRGEEYARGMSSSAGLVTGEGAVLSGATRWVPELAGDDLVTFALEARVPSGWEAISQGVRTLDERRGDETVVRWTSAEPQEEVLLVAGPLVERSRRTGRVLVQTFLRSDDPALSEKYLTTGGRYLAMYEALLGPYPYGKFALVENFWETGYGMPSFTLLGPRIIRFPFILHSSYPHEILHNWWGNGVFVRTGHGNWCEGLTAYLADHLVQEQRGEGPEYRRASLQRFADYVALNEDFAVREFRARHGSVTQAVGYDKVLMIFHMLRQRVGDARFVAGLRLFYETGRFRTASFEDLSRAMTAAAGEDLAPYFAQWVDRPGAPSLRLDAAEARGGDRLHVLELTLSQTQGGSPYALDVPVYVTLRGARQAVRRTVRLSERRQRFTLELEDAPVRVDVDAEHDVFRRLDPAELPPTLGGAFGASEAVMVLPSSAPPELRAAYAALAASWRRSGTEVVSDADLSRLPKGRAVWLFGWENRLRAEVAAAIAAHGGTLADDGLRAAGAALSRNEHAAVVAVRSPADAEQVVVLLAADDARALPALGRKLPHYGKYSLLGFEGADASNVAKHTWTVLASPLTAVIGGAGGLPSRGALPPRKALAELP